MFWRDDVDVAAEPRKVMIARGDLTDDTRVDEAGKGRRIPYKIYYPAEHDLTDIPVIIWSHGLGGGRDGAGFIARYIASHGYLVCNIQHRGTDTSLWEGKPGHPWDNIRKAHIPRSATLDRLKDVPFVLDHLNDLKAAHADAFADADLSNLGMSGHSFGSMTTQVMAGQLFPDAQQVLFSAKEPRFRAGILYSPVPVRHLTDAPDAEIYGPISMPLFHMTGTDDSSPVEGFGYELRQIVYQNAGGAAQHMLVMNGGDHMVYNGSRGQLEENPKRGVHEDIIRIASLAYWDMYLKGDKAAERWLTGGAFAAWLNGEGTYEMRQAA